MSFIPLGDQVVKSRDHGPSSTPHSPHPPAQAITLRTADPTPLPIHPHAFLLLHPTGHPTVCQIGVAEMTYNQVSNKSKNANSNPS